MKRRSPARIVVLVVVLVVVAVAFDRCAGDVRAWLVAMHGGRSIHGGR